MTSLDAYLQAMPKVELHIHLEGSVQPDTLFDLAQKNGITLPAADRDALRDWYTFHDFGHFLTVFMAICDCLRTPEDFERIAYEYGASMARQNIRYAEVTWTPYTHVAASQARDSLTFDDLLGAVNAGRERACREFGVEMRWIPDIGRSVPESAAAVVGWLTSPASRAGGVVALGLGGPEAGWPPELYEDAFGSARAAGLHSNPHAGEIAGPESVWGALRSLGAERLGHGVRAVEDPALVAFLAEHQVPLEVNPTSNLCLGVYPSYAQHPLRQLVEAGVCVTINSDDPALFNTSLVEEYRHAVVDAGLTLDQLEHVALNAARASYLPATAQQAMLHDFQREYARLRRQYGLD